MFRKRLATLSIIWPEAGPGQSLFSEVSAKKHLRHGEAEVLKPVRNKSLSAAGYQLQSFHQYQSSKSLRISMSCSGSET